MGRKFFVQKLNEEDDGKAMQRLLQTEQEIIDNRKTTYLFQKQRKKEIQELRSSKNSNQSELQKSTQRLQLSANQAIRQSDDRQQQLGHASARFGGENVGMANFENLSQQREESNGLFDPLIASPPMVIDVGEEHKNIMQNHLEQFETEKKANRILEVTDEEVMSEFDIFNEKIHKVSLKSRYFAWIFLMIMLIIGLALVYVSSFAHLYEPGADNPFAESTK